MKTFTYEEIENFLIKELEKTKHILTWGTIGSKNIENDIDTIVTKKYNSKVSDFYKEIHNILEKLNYYLNKKHNSKLIRISRFDTEEEVKKIAKYKNNDLVLHLLTYVSYSQIENHWVSNMKNKSDIKEVLNDYDCILGKKENLFLNDFKKSKKNEELFSYLNDVDRINSSYDEKTLCKVMNHIFKFIYGSKLFINYDFKLKRKDIKKEFYKLCDKLENDKEIREHDFFYEIENFIKSKLKKTKTILGFFKIGFSY